MEHRTMVEGTLHIVTGGRICTDGTVYALQKGRTMADGTLYDIGFGGLMLTESHYDSRNGAVITVSETQRQLQGRVEGGSNSSYAAVKWQLTKNGQAVLLQPGDRIRMSFTGTRYGEYCDYGVYCYTDPDSAWNSYVFQVANTRCSGRSWTVTTPCYLMFMAQIGGTQNDGLYASISVTDFTVNDEPVWAAV